MYTIRQYYGSADLVYTYVVGLFVAPNKFEPLVATDRLHYAIHMLNALNGGDMPNDITTFTNVMQAQSAAKEEPAPVAGDFKRGKLPEELGAKTNGERTDVDQYDRRGHRQGGASVE